MSLDNLRQYAMLDGEQLTSLWHEIDELRGALYDEQHGISRCLRNDTLDGWKLLAEQRLEQMVEDRKQYLRLRDFLTTIAYTGMSADDASEHAADALKGSNAELRPTDAALSRQVAP